MDNWGGLLVTMPAQSETSESTKKNGTKDIRRTGEGTCEHFKHLATCNVIRSF